MSSLLLVAAASATILAGLDPGSAAAQPRGPCKDGAACFEAGSAAARAGEPRKARAAYERGCRRDHAASCHELAEILRYGLAGKRTPVQAHPLDAKACRLGSPAGCYALGLDLESGVHEKGRRSVAVDLPRAMTHFRTACDGGVAASCLKLELYARLEQQKAAGAAAPAPAPAPAPPPHPICAGLATVLEARARSTLTSFLEPGSRGPARRVLDGALDCSVWGTREDVIYGCTMAKTGAAPSAPEDRAVSDQAPALAAALESCLRRKPLTPRPYRSATFSSLSYVWPDARVELFLRRYQDGQVSVSINISAACDRPNPESGLCYP